MGAHRCVSCRFYLWDPDPRSGADCGHPHSCLAQAYYQMEERLSPPVIGRSGLRNGRVVYNDLHLEAFWRGRVLCAQKLEWLLFRAGPVVVSVAALLVSMIGVISRTRPVQEVDCRCTCPVGP